MMMFDPTSDDTRPMAIYAPGRGLKGLFYRFYAAVLVLFGRKIPLMSIESSVSPLRGETVLPSEPFARTDPTGNDEHES